MHRFFLPPSNIQSDHVTFPEDLARQIALVLRLKPGAEVIVLDGRSTEYQVKLTEVANVLTSGEIIAKGLASTEPKTRVTLLLCLTQREKFEWILQKCTEIGVSVFIPVISSRSLIQSAKEVNAKYDRWQRILREAAEQSHRGIIPQLLPPLKLEEAVKKPELREDCRLIPWEEEKSLSLRSVLSIDRSTNVSLAIGPEGGFSVEEVDIARSNGFQPVSLGPRILRMETAAITAASLVLYERGDMDA